MNRRSAAVWCVVLMAAGLTGAERAAAQSTGGQPGPEPSRVTAVRCLPTPSMPCPVNGALVVGGKAAVRGKDLQATRRVVFEGRRGASDDVVVKPRVVAARHVEAVVSTRARSGPVTIINRFGGRATSQVRIRVEPAPIVAPESEPGAPRFFAGAKRQPRFSFTVRRPLEARIELVREADGSVVQTWTLVAEPGQPKAVSWDGRGPGGPQPAGRYRFRLVGEATSAAVPAAESDSSFSYYDQVFPIRGAHDLGQGGANNFGGGRGHKGQDMFAKCGTPVVAARGGEVEYAGFHAAAGNYVVVNGQDGLGYVYMHMRAAPLVRTGQRIPTGQALGEVGETGRATGCHLHFELWSAPGWYKGGSAVDPLPRLRAWDAYS